VRVELPGACFSFKVTSDGWIVQAASIAAWTIGKRGRAEIHRLHFDEALE
jgi:hypothetical protein